MSTIGFGDHYPVTTGGRIVIGSMFVVGASLIGMNIGIANAWMYSKFDKSIQNRVLKTQGDASFQKLDRIEKFLGIDQTVVFSEEAHGIDQQIEQKMDTNGDMECIITFGKDDSGRYVVAINERNVETDVAALR